VDQIENLADPIVETVEVFVENEKNSHTLLVLAVVAVGVAAVGVAGHIVGKRIERWNADRRRTKAQNDAGIKK
jgi:hypothetical protein